MAMIRISSEYSALPNARKPNPMVRKAIEYMTINGVLVGAVKVADQGCGALRHLKIMLESYNQIYLIDTKEQFNRKHTIEGVKTTTQAYLDNLQLANKQVVLMPNKEFSKTVLDLDAIFNICTFDVVLPKTRIEMLKAAKRNLREHGNFILIIPRNDTSILCRCKEENKYSDGFCFSHHGIYTFYTNFRNYKSLLDMVKGFGFDLVKDLSIYRQTCLIFTLEQ